MTDTQIRIVSAQTLRPPARNFGDWLKPDLTQASSERLPHIIATLSDGRTQTVLRHYGELVFTAGQFVGLSSDEVAALYFATDEAFLQGHPRARGSRRMEFGDRLPCTGPFAF